MRAGQPWRTLGVAALSLGVCAASAAAQPEEPITRLPALRVIAPSVESETVPRSWVPGRVETLTEADVERARPSVLPDVLQRLPGVTLQNEQGSSFQPDLTLRGFSASPVTGLPQGLSVFLDGVRLNEPTVEEVNFDLIPLEDVERIELIRGPSVLFGRNTLGGAINISTRRGEEIREIVPSLAGGSFGNQRYRLRLSGESGPVDYYLSFNQVLESGYRDNSDARLSRGFAKLGFQRGGTDVTVSYQFSNDKIKQAGALPEGELKRDRRANFTSGDFFQPELNQVIVNARQLVGDHWTISANAFVRALHSEQFNVNLISENTRLLNNVLSVGGTLQATHRDTIWGRQNILIVGAEYTHHAVKSKTFNEGDEARPLAANLIDTQQAIGVFAQDSLVLVSDLFVSGSALVLTVAGRWDGLRHEIEDRLGGPSGGASSYNRFNPRVGLNWTRGGVLSVYASYGEGFRAPAFLELTCAGPGAVCPGLQAGVAPDPRLDPVKSKTYEIGANARPFAWLDVNVSGYRTDVRDDIFSVSPTGTTGVFFQNIGSTRRQGVELTLTGRFRSLFEGYLNYAFTRATFQDSVELATPLPPGVETVQPGNSFALVPQHRLNGGLAYHPWPWATLSLDVNWASSQILRGDEVNRQRPLPGYWVANLGASVKLRGFEGFVKLNNLLNRQYETFGTFAVNGRAPGNPVERFLTPAPPINVLAGLRYTF